MLPTAPPPDASRCLKLAFTYDSKSDWLARGLSLDQCKEFESDETIRSIESALKAIGSVERIGGFKALAKRIATGPVDWDIVFNICEGYGTLGREAQVPALLEAWGINFTFSDSTTLALCIDKAKTKMILDHYQIPTAAFACVPARKSWPASGYNAVSAIDSTAHAAALQEYPLFLKPSSTSTGIGVSQANKVNNRADLERVLEDLSTRYPNQTILVERFLSGREFTVGIIGTGLNARVIGVRELVFLKDNPTFPIDPSMPYDNHDPAALDIEVYGHELKHQWSPNPQSVDMSMSDSVTQGVASVALRAWRALDCRDGGRVDIRHDIKGPQAVPNFIEVNPIAGLTPGWSDLPRLAEANGMDYATLIASIVDSALTRSLPKDHTVSK